MATVVTITSPAEGDAVTYPFTVTGTASPPGATVKLFNDVTGEVIGVGTSDGVTGAWSIQVTGAVAAMRAATVTPYGGSSQRRSSTTEGKKTATAQRSGKTTAQATGTARRSSKTDSVQGGVERRSETAQPAGGGADRRSAKTSANASATARRSSYSDAKDVTAPSVGTLTVPDTSGTSITGISASATDGVGVVGYMIKEAATDSFTAPAAGDAGWTSVTSTTSYSSSSLTFTSTATQTGTRYFRIYFKDASGNVGASATDSATITIASAGITYVGAGALTYGVSYGDETIAVPGSLADGDILILGGRGLTGASAGWTQVGTNGPFWKRVSGAQGSVSVTTDDGGGEGGSVAIRIYAFRGCTGSGSPIDINDSVWTNRSSVSTFNGTNLGGASMSANAMLVLLVTPNSRNGSSVGGGVDTLVAGGASSPTLHMAYDSTPPTSSGTITTPSITVSGGTDAGSVFTFALKAA